MPRVHKSMQKKAPSKKSIQKKTIQKKTLSKSVRHKPMTFANLPSNIRQKIIHHAIQTRSANYRGLPAPNVAMRKVRYNTNLARLPANQELNQVLMNPNLYLNLL